MGSCRRKAERDSQADSLTDSRQTWLHQGHYGTGVFPYSGSCQCTAVKNDSHSSRDTERRLWKRVIFSSLLGDVSLDKGTAERTKGTMERKRQCTEMKTERLGVDIWITFLRAEEKKSGEITTAYMFILTSTLFAWCWKLAKLWATTLAIKACTDK